MQLETIIRPSEMKAHTGECIAGTYAKAKLGLLCPPIKISRRASGFLLSEVSAVQRARIQGKSEDEIRQLVRDLIAKRAAAPESTQ
jgi:prophage regulatory protein